MKLVYKNIFIIIIFSLLFPKCVIDYDDDKLLIRNKSRNIVYCETSLDTTNDLKHFEWMSRDSTMKLYTNDTIRPLFARRGEGWENKINTYSIDSNLHIYFFMVDSVEKYGWKKVLDMRMYDRRDFRVKQLDSMHWSYDYYGKN